MSPAGRIAELLLEAHASRRPGKDIPLPGDLDEAYRIQDAVHARLGKGARPVAWKVGGPSADVEPTIAPILPGRLFASPARLAAAGFHFIGVEAEIAFRLAADVRKESTEKEIAESIHEAVVVIELCDSRLADWKDAAPLSRLADSQLNWGLVVGTGTTHWQQVDFTVQRAELWIGGAKRVDLAGGHPYGNPFRLMPWTARHLARRSGGLRAGDLVTTGSWGGMHFAAPEDEITARFPGVGEAAVRLSPEA